MLYHEQPPPPPLPTTAFGGPPLYDHQRRTHERRNKSTRVDPARIWLKNVMCSEKIPTPRCTSAQAAAEREATASAEGCFQPLQSKFKHLGWRCALMFGRSPEIFPAAAIDISAPPPRNAEVPLNGTSGCSVAECEASQSLASKRPFSELAEVFFAPVSYCGERDLQEPLDWKLPNVHAKPQRP